MPATKTTAFLAFVMFMIFSGFSKVYAQRYGRVVSFGDSLSDRGNYSEMTKPLRGGAHLTGPQHGNFEGRASNGYLWCEQLFAPQKRNDNFAFLAAQSGRTFDYLIDGVGFGDVPGFDYQIDLALHGGHDSLDRNYLPAMGAANAEYEALSADQQTSEVLNRIVSRHLKEMFADIVKDTPAGKIDSDTLCTVWVGMNDLRSLSNLPNVTEQDAFDCVHKAGDNIHKGINRLIDAGGRNFVVMGLPTIFQKQRHRDPVLDAEDCVKQRKVVDYFNFNLWRELQLIAAEHPDINIIPIDIAGLGELITSGHYDFGIKNTNQRRPCRPDDSTRLRDIREDPNTSLFWDHYGHLTAIGNKILADYIRMLIVAPFNVVPQMRACEKGASQAGRNVANRLFHLRGGLDVHSPSASGLVASAFTPANREIEAPLQDGQAAYLKAFNTKRNFAANTNIDPLDEQRLNAVPSINMGKNGSGKFGVFVSGDFYYGTRNDKDDVEGYRHTSKTLTLGADYRFAPWYLAGIAMSYTKGKTKLNADMGKITLDGYTVTLYNSFKCGGFYLDGAFAYGWNQIDVKRNIPQFLTTARAQPIGTNWGVSGLFGYDYTCDGLRIGPTANLNYGHTKVTSYREDGGLIFNMIVHEQNTKTFVGSIGGHASYDWKICGGTLTPTVRYSYDHEFKDRSRVLITELSSMRGIPYHLPVPSNDNNYYRIGGGLNWFANDNYSFSVDYETIVARKHARDHFFFVKYRQLF